MRGLWHPMNRKIVSRAIPRVILFDFYHNIRPAMKPTCTRCWLRTYCLATVEPRGYQTVWMTSRRCVVVERCALAACRVFATAQTSIISMRMLQAIFTQARKSNRTQNYKGNRLWKPFDSVPRRRVVFATARTGTGHPCVWPVGGD